MLELIILVLLFCNKDGSKKSIINGLSVVGILLTIVLALFYTAFALVDTLLYVIFMIIGNSQG